VSTFYLSSIVSVALKWTKMYIQYYTFVTWLLVSYILSRVQFYFQFQNIKRRDDEIVVLVYKLEQHTNAKQFITITWSIFWKKKYYNQVLNKNQSIFYTLINFYHILFINSLSFYEWMYELGYRLVNHSFLLLYFIDIKLRWRHYQK